MNTNKRYLLRAGAAVMAWVMAVSLVLQGGMSFISRVESVKAADYEYDADFDCSINTVIETGTSCGVIYTLYNNGLLWLQDDPAYESGNSNINYTFKLSEISTDCKTVAGVDIKYVYCNASLTTCFGFARGFSGIEKVRFGDIFIEAASKITNYGYMFYGCSSLKEVPSELLNSPSVSSMEYMFYGCSSLVELDLSGIVFKGVSKSNFIDNCEQLHILKTPRLVNSAHNLGEMWYVLDDEGRPYAYRDYIPGESYSYTLVRDSNHTYVTHGDGTVSCSVCGMKQNYDIASNALVGSGCYSGVSWRLYENGLLWLEDDTTGATNYGDGRISRERFSIKSLRGDSNFVAVQDKNILYLHLDITAPASCEYMCEDYDDFLDIRLGLNFLRTSGNITNANKMFAYNYRLYNIQNINALITGNITDMSAMFYYCQDLVDLDVSGFDTSKVTDMSCMFGNCRTLDAVDVSGFDTRQVTNMSKMFAYSSKIETIDVSGFNTDKVTNMAGMFESVKCKKLDLSGFNTSQVTDMSSMFSGCSKLEELDVSGFDTSKVTNMSGMFSGVDGVSSLDVSNFDTSQVTNMSSMFANIKSNLKTLDLSSFDTSSLTCVDAMFSFCRNLKVLDLSSFNLSLITNEEDLYMCIDLDSGSNLHVLYTPTNLALDYALYNDWCKMSESGHIDETVVYNAITAGCKESMKLVRIDNHTFTTDENGIEQCVCEMGLCYGDVNDDGKVDLADAVMLKKVLAGDQEAKDAMNGYNSDVNSDGEVDLADAVKLMKKLAGMNVVLGASDD
ncbi:MAG: BspA family leucine-rich repeat surface protein [Lachnospira sp.]|nr:BspA family leucine-rich repeat surface protein [Lachnospira sp.]